MYLKIITIVALSVITSAINAQQLLSPNGNIAMHFLLDEDGQPSYTLTYKSKSVIEQSRLGLLFKGTSLNNNFEVKSTEYAKANDVWQPVWGEYAEIDNHYNELLVTLSQRTDKHREIAIRFRLFDDGLGFRYELPEQHTLNYLTVTDELTEFNQNDDNTFFCIPGDYDTNEFAYTTAPISQIRQDMEHKLRYKSYESEANSFSVQTPLLIKTTNGLYVNIHEAALIGYSAMLLNVDEKNFKLSTHLTPDKNGDKGFIQLPFNTPWRTIIVSDDARDILASQLILNLNEPCSFSDVSWIKPQKFIGVWWEMFIGTGQTWAYSDKYNAQPGTTNYDLLTPNGRHPANTNHVKEYIDFAAKNGIDAVLVEGWNEGWEDWGGYVKNRQFLFNKPYPDFDINEIERYAAQKGVKIIMHHETAANAADYSLQMDDAFRFMTEHGYESVKTGYVGHVIPRSEYHSSQWMNDHYIEVVRKAAQYHIMVDSHEAVRPTGLCRTYPNWLAQESARGGEFESMGGNAPDHTTILPFTRLKGGPMDYTPGILQTQLSYYNGEKNNQYVHTTLVKQLALYLTMPSPIQMAADLPANYIRFADAFQFIRDVPVDWSDSKYLEAEPGDYITVARKDKHSENWFVGAITDENERTAVIKFDFLPIGSKYEATIYEDTKNTHYQTNPMSYNIRKIVVDNKSVIKQHLACSGGVAISLKKL